ncbi:MAG: ribose-phosphate diphosphokinase [Candidatus Micrarchaeia archaeon]
MVILISPNCMDFARELDGKLIETRSFPDGERYVRIPIFNERNVVLLHRCYPNANEALIELFLMLRQTREMGARNISCIIPYMPYARQDKRFLEGEAVSAKTICSLIKSAGCDELITFDCHFLKKEGVFDYAGLWIRNISMGKELLRHFDSYDMVVSPDMGAAYLVGKNGETMEKRRGSYGKGRKAYRKVEELVANFDVAGKRVVVIDDMISTGSTMVKAVKILKKKGAKSVSCCATHGLFLGKSLEELKKSGALRIITSDTIRNPVARVGIIPALREKGVIR